MKLVSIRSIWFLVFAVVAIGVVSVCGRYLWVIQNDPTLSMTLMSLLFIPMAIAGEVFGAALFIWAVIDFIIVGEES